MSKLYSWASKTHLISLCLWSVSETPKGIESTYAILEKLFYLSNLNVLEAPSHATSSDKDINKKLNWRKRSDVRTEQWFLVTICKTSLFFPLFLFSCSLSSEPRVTFICTKGSKSKVHQRPPIHFTAQMIPNHTLLLRVTALLNK